MSALSIARHAKSHFVVAANPIYLLSEVDYRIGALLTFEVMEADSSLLPDFVGQREYYSLDGGQPFWAELLSLEPGESTQPALALLRDKPVLRGVFRMLGDEAGVQ